MKTLNINNTTVEHLCADACRMSISYNAGPLKIKAGPPAPKAKAFSAAKAGSTKASLDEALASEGFEPWADALEVPAPKIAKKSVASAIDEPPPSIEVKLDAPDGYYILGVVTTGTDRDPTFLFPEDEVLLSNTPHASAFSHSAGDSEKPKLEAKARAVFSIPANAVAPAGPLDGSPSIKAFGIGGAVKRIVRFFKVKIVKAWIGVKGFPDKIKGYVAKKVDKLINPKPGLKLVSSGMKLRKASDKQLKAMEGKEVLLFVHGIISSITGAFDELAKGNAPPLNTWLGDYENRVLGFDHYTLSQSTLENAQELIARIPKGSTLNIICHSRGAGVVRCLLEHKSLKVQRKNFKVNKVCFVAGACLGSPLAEKSTVNRLFNVLGLLFGKSLPTKVLSRIAKLLLHGIQDFPGVESMAASSALIKELNKSKSTHAKEYIYLRANFDPKNLPARIADELTLDQLIFNGANDVVVPYAGAGVSTVYLKGAAVKKVKALDLGSAKKPQHAVWHTGFFEDPLVRKKLLKQV